MKAFKSPKSKIRFEKRKKKSKNEKQNKRISFGKLKIKFLILNF